MTDLKTGVTQHLPGAETALAIAPGADGNIWTEWRLKTNEQRWGHGLLQKTTPQGFPIGPQYQIFNQGGGFIWSIFEEKTDRVLLGLVRGLMVLNPLTGESTHLSNARFPELELAAFYFIKRDRAGQIWACGSQGVYLFHNGRITDRFWPGGQGDHYLPYENILHLYEDAEGIFWLATAGGGLIRWDRKATVGRQTQVIFRKNGLLNGVVYASYEDRHGHLWLPTDMGIAQLDKKALLVRRTWVKADGITHNEFNRISHCQGADGSLYFGGLNGITAFQPDNFYKGGLQQKEPALLAASAFQVLNGNSGRLENRLPDLLTSRTFTMYPGDRYLQLEFALLDYIASDQAAYFWHIDGITQDWELLNEPVLRLSGLPYGQHKLILRAQASNGVWAKNDLEYMLNILPPVYLRWWFISLVIVFLAIGIWSWLRWRIRRHREQQQHLEQKVNQQTATIRRQTEELKKLDQAKSRFFANVTHELRTPLTLILGPVGSMLKSRKLEDRNHALALVVQQQGQRLLQIVNEILDLSKLESGTLQVRATPVLLRSFLCRLTGNFESHAEMLGIRFEMDYALPGELKVWTDPDKVETVLNNLLSNALKFTPPHADGRITVAVSDVDGNIRITVTDTGRGIHPDDLPRVFDRFFQSTRPEIPIEGGTGIGLALCRELAQVLEGRIRVESTLGKGSMFCFEFPAKEAFDAAAPASDAGRPVKTDQPALMQSIVAAPPSGAPRILLVEDNENLRDYIRLILSESYDVSATENGRAALNWLEKAESPPDLILSDLMMPLMDGFQLLEHLKGDDRWRHIPVIMLTARADVRDKLQALRIGVDDYLLKPFEEEELIARIANLLRNAGRRWETEKDPRASLAPPARQFSAEDQAWLEQFEQVVHHQLATFNLTADLLADEMAMSRSSLFRQLKRLTGLSPLQYVDEARFQKARMLLETRAVSSVKAAAYAVGFKQVKNFSQNYRKRFGKHPSEQN